jgi:hypothetical protein
LTVTQPVDPGVKADLGLWFCDGRLATAVDRRWTWSMGFTVDLLKGYAFFQSEPTTGDPAARVARRRCAAAGQRRTTELTAARR